MHRFPFFGFPYQYPYNSYYRKGMNTDNLGNNSESTNSNCKTSSETNNRNDKTSKYRQPFSFNFDGFSDNSKPIAELLGINLYIDDIIILCLLFILYKEEVKDAMLFICLLLLLIS